MFGLHIASAMGSRRQAGTTVMRRDGKQAQNEISVSHEEPTPEMKGIEVHIWMQRFTIDNPA